MFRNPLVKLLIFLSVISILVAKESIFNSSKNETGDLNGATDFLGIHTTINSLPATGTIYTSVGNMQDYLETRPWQQPYLVSLNNNGEVHDLDPTDTSPFFFTPVGYGLFAYALHDAGSERRSATWYLQDESGQVVTTARVKDNEHTDPHFLLMTSSSTFIIPSQKLHQTSNGLVESTFLEEQDLEGHVLWAWDSLEHISPSERIAEEDRPYWVENEINDYFHGNSLALTNDGNLLLSARNTSQVLKIDRITGEVLWQLGGVKGDFLFIDDPLGGFSHQHTATQLSNGNILIYDNGNGHVPPQTRVVEYKLDEENMTATLVWSHESDRFTPATGSAQRLVGGNTLIGWGIEKPMSSTTPRITEVDSSGHVVMEVFFPDNVLFYSAYKY